MGGLSSKPDVEDIVKLSLNYHTLRLDNIDNYNIKIILTTGNAYSFTKGIFPTKAFDINTFESIPFIVLLPVNK